MTLYYYEDYIHNDWFIVEEYIAQEIHYNGEEELLRLQENEIYIIEDEYELKQWCIEYGEDYDEQYSKYFKADKQQVVSSRFEEVTNG